MGLMDFMESLVDKLKLLCCKPEVETYMLARCLKEAFLVRGAYLHSSSWEKRCVIQWESKVCLHSGCLSSSKSVGITAKHFLSQAHPF